VKLTFEIRSLEEEAASASKLLYVPPSEDFTYRSTRVYHLEFEGTEEQAEDLIRATLLDPITQVLHVGESPALSGHVFHLDYGMKTSALDLEKEAILANWREMAPEGFEARKLLVRTRIYLFPAGDSKPNAEDYLRDIVNPAIHTWEVNHV